MSLSIGIVGLPNVGKSTLFNAITNLQVEAANYPFATVEPNVGVVAVPDERLAKLAEIERSQQSVYTTVEFNDIAGLVAGAHKGEGLGNQFLSHIREVDVIVEVVRFFSDDNITHVAGSVDPRRDIETIETELGLADLQMVEKKLDNLKKESKTGNKETLTKVSLAQKYFDALSEGKLAAAVEATDEEKKYLHEFPLLTRKPIIYVANLEHDADDKGASAAVFQGAQTVVELDAQIESEISQLDVQERQDYLSELGLKESGLDKLIRAAYEALGLISFFTAGEQEARAWTVEKGSRAPRAAGQIHTDFEKGFIKADVVSYDKFVSAGGWAGAREKGWVRTEGKEYVVADGDVMLFKFSS